MADMYKLCPVCGTLNSGHSVVCEKPECKVDLTYAQEVYGTESAASAHPPSPPTGNNAPPNSDDHCTCKTSQPGADDPSTCWCCNLPIRADAVPAKSVAQGQVFIVLPGNVRVGIGAGFILGRDIRVAPAPIRGLLAAYPGLSRVHAWVGCDGRDVTVLDLGSRNGTWLNEQRLEPGLPFTCPLHGQPVKLRLGQFFVSTLEQESS